jgi:hypothetical protein
LQTPAGHIVPGGARDRPHVDAAVIVETPVFDRDDGFRQQRRNMIGGNALTLEDAARRERSAVFAFEYYCARRRLHGGAAGKWDRGDAIGDIDRRVSSARVSSAMTRPRRGRADESATGKRAGAVASAERRRVCRQKRAVR